MVCVTPSTQGKEDEGVQRLAFTRSAFGAVGTRFPHDPDVAHPMNLGHIKQDAGSRPNS